MAERRCIYECPKDGCAVRSAGVAYCPDHPGAKLAPVEVFSEAEIRERMMGDEAIKAAARRVANCAATWGHNGGRLWDELNSSEQGGYIADAAETQRAALDAAFSDSSTNGDVGRSITEIREWIRKRYAFEERNAPGFKSSAAAGVTVGALEVLGALKDYLNGDDDA